MAGEVLQADPPPHFDYYLSINDNLY